MPAVRKWVVRSARSRAVSTTGAPKKVPACLKLNVKVSLWSEADADVGLEPPARQLGAGHQREPEERMRH